MYDIMDTVIILRSYWESIKDLPDDKRLFFLESIIEYGLNGIEPTLTGLEKSLWVSMKSSVDANIRRYNTSVENGRKGGAPKGNKNAKKQPELTQNNPIQPETTKNNLNKDKDKDKDIDKDMNINKDIDKESSRENLFKHIPGFVQSINVKPDTDSLEDVDKYIESLFQSKLS